MKIPGKAVAIGAGLVVGIILGSAINGGGETVTEVRVIEVPTVRTKIEYRDKIQPFPEECTDALDALPKIIEGDAAQTAAVGKILLALQDLSTASAFNDTNAVNEAITIVRKEKGVLSATIAGRSTAIKTYEVFLSKCEAAIAASS